MFYSYTSELKTAECECRVQTVQRTTDFSGHERQIQPAHRSAHAPLQCSGCDCRISLVAA